MYWTTISFIGNGNEAEKRKKRCGESGPSIMGWRMFKRKANNQIQRPFKWHFVCCNVVFVCMGVCSFLVVSIAICSCSCTLHEGVNKNAGISNTLQNRLDYNFVYILFLKRIVFFLSFFCSLLIYGTSGLFW